MLFDTLFNAQYHRKIYSSKTNSKSDIDKCLGIVTKSFIRLICTMYILSLITLGFVKKTTGYPRVCLIRSTYQAQS